MTWADDIVARLPSFAAVEMRLPVDPIEGLGNYSWENWLDANTGIWTLKIITLSEIVEIKYAGASRPIPGIVIGNVERNARP